MELSEKVIGGRTFRFRRCSATNALDLELSLARAGASGLAGFDWEALKGLSGDAMKLAIGTQIGEVVGSIAQKLSLADLKRLMVLVFNHTDCDGATIGDRIDEVFADRPAEIWQAFIGALDHNLRPFVAALPNGSSSAANPAAQR